MKSVSQLATVTNLQRSMNQPKNPNVGVKSDETARHVNFIFRELLSACPAWNARFERNPAELNALKQSYLKGLVENGLSSMDAIQKGIRNARMSESDFFPSVGKFINWCRNDDFIQCFERFMQNNKPQNQFEKLVFTDAVHANVKRKAIGDDEKTFKRIFDKWIKRFSAGDIPQDVPALPPRSVVMPTDIARERCGVPKPEQFRKGSVFARIAERAQGGVHGE
ncbi:hypothetical protein P0F40_000855 [Vibrio metschnikovii]|uniref:replication protein P n=1 Tax=Vibrio TaxID=662 RepID=UPI001482D40A|nr:MULTISPECIES: replication protein P [unclassified Vibrio]EKO3556519.1 hypothetical protein [Vibrio metschnikovii]EKO3721400.1 hypothetical protein [Vibrio metschnikovii]EKO3725911.1 hypothetical protein [Vibrio metschnikovii]EKO3772620.1 hypothetical protein [Vibrio metschnikovii]EKO3875100.1 hypothetical protein [Vibrio metschnikovii]